MTDQISYGANDLIPASGMWLTGASETSALIRNVDWSRTPLGALSSWPQSLRSTVDTMLASKHGMMLAWGPELTLIYNDAYAPFLGQKHPDAIGQPFRLAWSEIWDDIKPLVEQALAGEAVWFEDYNLTIHRSGHPEDTWWQFSYSPVRDESGMIVGMLNVANEKTATVLAERKLREINADLEQRVAERASQRAKLWQVSTDLLCVIDIETAALEAVNPAWTATFGWSIQELEGRLYVDFVHPDDLGASADAFEQIRAGSPVLRFENRYRTKNGEWRWLSWVALPEGGKLYSTIRDITDEKRRLTELEATQDALRQSQKMEAMGQLTGGVAHDFNNLLTPIIGSLDMLTRRGVGNERERRLIDGALQSAERAKTLVQRLLAFARRQPLQATAVDLPTMMDGMAGLIDSTLGPKIIVRVELAPDLPPAIADANQMEMALLNLAVNARDAMPEGGSLTIGATRESVRPGHRTALPRGHYVRLFVTDTGSGMDDDTRMRAVEPFFSTKGVGKGTGLGLSMVHGLVGQLGGRLMIESAPARGTTIEMWLPVSLAPIASDDISHPAAGLAEGQGTVLLVDDEPLVRMITADMLMDFGFEVVEVGSADEALRLIEAGETPDVVVTDHLMPGMSGADFADWLGTARPGLPVLIVSGYAEVEGISADTARLSKPFRNTELASSLAALMPAFQAPASI